MHNWLLDIDGFRCEWNGGIAVSDWAGPLGGFDFDCIPDKMSSAIACLLISRNLDLRNGDSSRMGHGRDVIGDQMLDNEHLCELVMNSVSHLNLSVF